jgi:hypothetical protein
MPIEYLNKSNWSVQEQHSIEQSIMRLEEIPD